MYVYVFLLCSLNSDLSCTSPLSLNFFSIDAQCAALELLGLVDGVLSDDSDCFVFGCRNVYRHAFEEKKFVEWYSADRIRRDIGLHHSHFVALALLLGSDYAQGVRCVFFSLVFYEVIICF